MAAGGFTCVVILLFHVILLTGGEHVLSVLFFDSTLGVSRSALLLFFPLQLAISPRITYRPIRFPKYQFPSMTLTIWTPSNSSGHRLSCFLTQTRGGAVCPACRPPTVWVARAGTHERHLVFARAGPTGSPATCPTRADRTAFSPRGPTGA